MTIVTPAEDLVRQAATQLYAGPPAEFIKSRTALVKQAKAKGHKDEAKEIAALRKPSVAAWVLNQLVHGRHPVIGSLADVGARLRQATASLDAAGLAGMRQERDAVLRDLVSVAEEVSAGAGQPISAAVQAEVRDTGIAALADEAAEQVLGSGTLTRALSYSGFGEVDLAEAAATTSTGVVLTSIRGGRRAGDEPLSDTDRDHTASDHTASDDTASDDTADIPSDDTELDDERDEIDGDDEPGVSAENGEDGAAALAEAAAAAEHERRLAQAEAAVELARKEIGRRRSAVDGARNRTEATRQRIQKLEDQLVQARREDDEALGQLTDAVAAAKRAGAALEAAEAHLAEMQRAGSQKFAPPESGPQEPDPENNHV